MTTNLITELRLVLRGSDPSAIDLPPKPLRIDCAHYASWRLLHAWKSAGRFGADQAILLRQAVRWGVKSLPIVSRSDKDSLLRAVGISAVSGFASADPFVPDFLLSDNIELGKGIDTAPVVRKADEQIPAESFLQYRNWKSQALKEASWVALNAPHGSTTLIALPTGSGKSLCFQLLSRFQSGLTVVIVPTVALAIDQFRAAKESAPELVPTYYSASDGENDTSQTIETIRSGKTRILFTSPESCVSGKLRFVLEQLAREGRLDHLVIDEAHMVATWGVFFRVDFQMLSVLWRLWRKLTEGQLRTFLLSATFTEDCRRQLQQLFSDGDTQWQEFVSQRLRPELIYYMAPFMDDDSRTRAVTQCIWRLPRPLILYATEVAEATDWTEQFRLDGFKRVGCFTGETSSSERRSLLDGWRHDEIDIMVATSAFGLGVDKQDVSAVVHACLPENLDRYYQEAGRAGRDGNTAICVLLPTGRDRKVASGLGAKLLGTRKLQQRWDALWRLGESVPDEDLLVRVPLNAKRSEMVGTRTWSQNVLWNKRLILQLMRAGQLELRSLQYEDGEDEDPTEWALLKLRFSPTSTKVATSISEVRNGELKVLHEGLRQMIAVVEEGGKVCGKLRDLYGAGTQWTCSGCPGCRRRNRPVLDIPRLAIRELPFMTPESVVVANCPDLWRESFDVIRLLRVALTQFGIRRFATVPDALPRLLQLANEAFRSDTRTAYRVDALSPDSPLVIKHDELLIFFHVSDPSMEAFNLRSGLSIIHLVCRAATRVPDGRSVLDLPGILPFQSPDSWLAAWRKPNV